MSYKISTYDLGIFSKEVVFITEQTLQEALGLGKEETKADDYVYEKGFPLE